MSGFFDTKVSIHFFTTNDQESLVSLEISQGQSNEITLLVSGATREKAYAALVPKVDELTDAINQAMYEGKQEIIPPGNRVADFRITQAAYKETHTDDLRGEVQCLWAAMSDAEQREIAGVPE